MNVQLEFIISKYVGFYPGKTSSYIASKIILDKEVTDLSHATVRRRVLDYMNSRLPKNEVVSSDGLGNITFTDASKIRFAPSQADKNREAVKRLLEDDYIYSKPFTPEESVKVLQPYLNGNPDNILIIGDTHLPFEREGYLQHCREIQERFNCGKVVHIGDEVDNHAISYHESDAEADSAGAEFTKALAKLKDWYRVFPEVTVIVGNHSALPFRKANTAGLTKKFLKAYEEIWEAPKGWEWKVNYEYNDIYFTHNASTKPLNMAINRRQSVVGGHYHTIASIDWNVSKHDRIFGMNVGSGIDDSSYAFAYSKDNAKKSIVSCAVILNGLPMIIPMSL